MLMHHSLATAVARDNFVLTQRAPRNLAAGMQRLSLLCRPGKGRLR